MPWFAPFCDRLITGTAMELNFSNKIAFLSTPGQESDITARRDYIREYLHAGGFFPSDSSLDNMVAPTEELPLVDRQKMLDTCSPLGQDIAAKMEWQLIQKMESIWHVPLGEEVLQSTVGVLANDYQGCPANSLVIIRRTDKATVAFLLQRLRVDVQNLRLVPASVQLPGLRTATAAALVGSDDGVPNFEDCTKITLSTLSTLAFALPEPWGVITSAGLGLILAFFPDDKPDPLAKLEENLIKFQKHQELGAIAMDAHALTHWLNEQLAAWRQAEKKGGSDDLRGQIDRWERQLDNFMEGGRGTVYNDLQQIQRGDLSDGETALAVHVMTISAYMAGQKFAILLGGLKASIAKSQGDIVAFNQAVIEWRISYNNLVIQILGDKQSSIVGFAAIIDNWIGKRKAERMSQISGVKRFDYAFPSGYVPKYGVPAMGHIESAFSWEDKEDGGTRYYYPDRDCNWTGDVCAYHTYEDKAKSEHDAHVANVASQLETKYADLEATVRGWQSAMLQWANKMPPGPAKEPPAVHAKSWKEGEESPWKDHRQVQYAVAFANGSGPGEISAWSESATIAGTSPEVAIYVDAMKQATMRHLFRKFDGDEKTLQCSFVADNTTEVIVDSADRKWVDWKLPRR